MIALMVLHTSNGCSREDASYLVAIFRFSTTAQTSLLFDRCRFFQSLRGKLGIAHDPLLPTPFNSTCYQGRHESDEPRKGGVFRFLTPLSHTPTHPTGFSFEKCRFFKVHRSRFTYFLR